MEDATNNNPPLNGGATTTSCARYHFTFVKDGVARSGTMTDTYIVNPSTWIYTGRIPTAANPTLSISAGSTTTFTATNNASVSPSGYQWRKGGTAIGGATAAAYTIPSATVGDSGSYDCVVTYPDTYGLGTPPTMTSNSLTLTVTSGVVPATAAAITPLSSTVNPSDPVTLTNTVTPANATNPVYAWYSNTSSSTTGGSLIPGQTGSTYAPSTGTSGTVWYYGTVTAGGATVTSAAAAQVRVRSAPTISVQPASVTVTTSGTATFSITAADAGYPTLTYQWQSLPPGGAWTDLPGATTTSYSPGTLINATQYRCLLVNAGGLGVTTTSATATLTVVSPPTITTDTIPLNPAALAGSTVSFAVAASIPATPVGTLSYQWQRRASAAGTFADVVGATAASLDTTATTDGEQFRCRLANTVNGVAATTTSRITTITVAALTAPTFTTQPASVSIATGNVATFTVLAAGVPTPTLQWYESTDNSTYAMIGGATSTTYTTPATTAADVGVPRYYRCTATNAAGSVDSAVAIRTVTGVSTGIAYVKFTSSAAGGAYAPKHVMAAWIQRGSTYVATLGDWSSERKVSLVLWNSVNGGSDAVMGATQLSHAPVVNLAWHFDPATTPDGTYSLWLESADDNTGPIGAPTANSVPGANRARLDFTIVSGAVVAATGAMGGFSDIAISPIYDAAAATAAAGSAANTSGKVASCGSGSIFALMLAACLLLALFRRRG